jgi:signal transduction histidine kinase
MTILLVDDQPGVRLLLQTILKDSGYADVIAAESARQAFIHLGVDQPSPLAASIDLILMDISMPEINGVEACRKIKSLNRFKDIPIIMVTALDHSSSLESAFAAGATDYITKPPNAVELLVRVRSALESKWEKDFRKSSHVIDLEAKNQELKSAFGELEKRNQELEDSLLARTQILATATHELKTPLTSIIGYVDRMLRRRDTVGELNQKQTRYLATVQKNALRLKALVDDLLDISRIEAGGLELNLLDLDVFRELEDAIQSVQDQISDKQIALTLDIGADTGRIRADRLRFGQVITNLLSNACKYSPDGSNVTVSAFRQDQLIQIDISDTGIGISEADQAKLFTKFFRADNTPTRQQSGTGLGLYITRHLIEVHHGAIWTESTLGEGTTFHLIWPATATPRILTAIPGEGNQI